MSLRPLTLRARLPLLSAKDMALALWCLAAALLGLEAVLLSARFDTDRLIGQTGWWVPVLRFLPYVAHLLAFSLAATLVLGHERLAAALPELLANPQREAGSLRAFLCSSLGFLLFAIACVGLIEHPPQQAWLAHLELLVLAASAGFWLIATLNIAAPLDALLRCFLNTADRLVAGLTVGALVFWAARAFESQEFLWEPLSRATVIIAASVARTFGLDVATDPASLVLGTDRFAVIVTRFCSGYEGIGLYLLCTGTFLVLAKRHLHLPKALWILPIGALLVWLFNAVRIAALVAIGHSWSSDLAMQGFHTHAGWIPLILVSLGSVAIATRHPALSKHAPRDLDAPPTNPTAAHLMPLLTLVAVGLLSGAFLTDPRLAIPARALLGGFMIFYLRRFRAPLWTAPDRRLLWAVPAAVVIWILSSAAQGLLHTPEATFELPTGLPHGAWWALAILSYAWVTPVAEELAFRGFLQRRLIDRDFELVPQGALTPLALIATAILFAVLHGNLVGGLIIAGLLAWATTWRGRLADAIQLHAAINLALVLAAFALGRHDLWLGAGK